MAKTLSTMLPLGTPAPDFTLPSATGEQVKKADFQGEPLLVMFICNHCPYVKHLRHSLAEFGRTYQSRGLRIVAINANDAIAYPDDAPAKMQEEARDAGYTFPYLYDETQKVAQAFRAACTPEFYLFAKDHNLVYRGQYDESRPGNGIPVSGASLRSAADALLAGKPISADQKPSIGCNIKWKVGNSPTT